MNNRGGKSQCMNFRLPTDVLLEIFCRIRSFKAIVRCKCVCKQWLNLLSEPGFEAQYIGHRINAHMSRNSRRGEVEEENPFIFCFRQDNHKPLIYPAHPGYRPRGSGLEFLPTGRVRVLAWCNDLVLCNSLGPQEPDLYICNPRTRQYVKLPAPSYRKHLSLAGFYWDPYYMFNKETGRVTVNVDRRYIVFYAVTGVYPSARLKVEIFSSETRVWKKAVLLTPKRFDYPSAMRFNCFMYKGRLHFHCYREILSFDPYKVNNGDDVIRGHIIQMPPYEEVNGHIRSVSLGAFGGKLLLIEYCARSIYPEPDIIGQVSMEQDNALAITVWELENYHTGEWIMKHRIYLHDLVSEDPVLTEHIKRGCPRSYVLYFYPNDPDILVLKFPQHIVECRLKGKTLKKVGRFRNVQKVYGLALLSWPSPLPSDIEYPVHTFGPRFFRLRSHFFSCCISRNALVLNNVFVLKCSRYRHFQY